MATTPTTRESTETSRGGSPDLQVIVGADAKLSKAERTRRRILHAAEEVFGRLGFHEASIVEITQRAGVAQGTFYLYFPSKLDIFREVLHARGKEMRAHIASSVAGIEDRRAIERAGLRAYFAWVAEHPHAYRVARQADFVDPTIMKDWFSGFADAYAAGLRTSMEAGEVPEADPHVLAWAVIGMADFTALRFIIWDEGHAPLPEAALDAMVACALRALGLGDTPA